MSLSTVSLPDFVKLGEVIWEKGRDEFVPEMRRSGIVKEVRVPMNSGNTREFSEIDLEQYASVKAEGDQAAIVQNQQGYSKVGTLYRVSFAETISYETRTQGKYPEVTAKLTNLLPAVMARMELDLQHRVTYATATSYTDKDGRTIDTTLGDTKALAATDHTVRASSSTFRNRLANNPQLSRGSLEAMEKMRVENSINQFGQKIPCSDDILWTTDDPNTINTARELLQATASLESGSNSGVPNVYRGKYRHVKLSRVATDKDGNVDSTKAKYWGLASSRYSSFYLGVHEEPHVIVPSAKDDALTDDWVMRSAGGWMVTIVSAGFFALSTGDGTS